MIHLVMSHPALAAALRIVLQSDLALVVGDGTGTAAGDAVVTTTVDTSLSDCRALSDRGASVVVLTPLVTEAGRAAYLRAGATEYLEMSVSAAVLLEAVRTANVREAAVPSTD